MAEPESAEQFVRRFFEHVWNRRSHDAIDEMLSSDCKAYGLPDPDVTLCGREEFRAVHRMFCGAFPDLQIKVQDVIAAGDRVARVGTPPAPISENI